MLCGELAMRLYKVSFFFVCCLCFAITMPMKPLQKYDTQKTSVITEDLSAFRRWLDPAIWAVAYETSSLAAVYGAATLYHGGYTTSSYCLVGCSAVLQKAAIENALQSYAQWRMVAKENKIRENSTCKANERLLHAIPKY